LVTDQATWSVLALRDGIHLPNLDGSYLHDDDPVEQWPEEVRDRCQVLRVPDGT
jgi:hypothetical protein